ncbi:putative oxidoreductase fad-binding domain-containing protein [Diaporthe ampelina]|uniref:Putative oxidoreductase fad-binding domain-containing protein n=1 Tax=Diaporthe ampelina TaxID=1214573 RepID=A0A0G2F8C4_9PEZI|nr:putative oxidoreductase fad-binding domain-containing protein [Diaporthe ampelina]
MTLHLQRPSWHAGELAVHKLVRVPTPENPTSAGFPARYGYRVQQSPLVALGALDDNGRPWTTIWGGVPGFARPIGHDLLMARSLVDAGHDPVVAALFGGGGSGAGKGDGGPIKYQMDPADFASGGGKVVSGLSIDLATRDRVKVGGRLVEGGIVMEPGPLGGSEDGVARAEVVVLVEEGLGNCPKYLNKRDIRAAVPEPQLVSDALPLPPEAVELLGRADLFFLSTASADSRTMDTNHRGGPPGFVRVMRNSRGDGVDLVYPEYSGNRLYQSLGNMHVRPLVGVCVPDFGSGDVLYLTGETQILVGADAGRVLPHTKLAVKIRVTAARYVAKGLPFRGGAADYSPYNPPVRRLAAEKEDPALPQGADAKPPATATLVSRDIITPTVARFTFRLETSRKLERWRPGQHVTLDFAPELDMGWSHMREDDPASLNDDFVRTFTVSNAPPAGAGGSEDTISDGTELQVTVRRHGPATGLLWTQNPRAPLELPVLGFGGSEEFRAPLGGGGGEKTKAVVFVAGGVGITPILAQAPGLLRAASPGGPAFSLLWSLRAPDLPLALDSFSRCEGLAARSRVFVSGEASAAAEVVSKLEALGAVVKVGRLTRDDVLPREDGPREGERRHGEERKYYCCAGPGLIKVLLGWLEGEEVVYESFEY